MRRGEAGCGVFLFFCWAVFGVFFFHLWKVSSLEFLSVILKFWEFLVVFFVGGKG